MKNRTRIGIVTYHNPYSYGACLQCFGLLSYLKGKGYEAEIIDYSMSAHVQGRTKHPLRFLVLKICSYLSNGKRIFRARKNAAFIETEKKKFERELAIRNSKFEQFHMDHYILSPQKYAGSEDIKCTPPQYDAYICGSDQIWNPNFCDMDDNYFLSFAPQESRISYAPSFGITAIPWYARREYARRLSTIPYLSIREQQGASIIKKLTGRDVPVVIDPTFLIKREQWQEIANESTLDLPQEYILTYFIGIDSYIEDLISKVKKSFPDKRVINLVFDKTEYGPADFLLLISKASFVLTNSFHGAAFCINFNVPFLIGKSLKDMTPNSAFNRMENLLKELGLSDRICDRVNTFDASLFNLDFASVNRRRQQLVDQSTKFLDDSINKVLNHR